MGTSAGGVSALSFLADLAPERGFPLPRRIHEPTTLGARRHGPRRRPDRCDPRLRGVQAPELPDKEVQAQQPRSHQPAQVLQVVPASYRAPRDALGTTRWPPIVHAGERTTPRKTSATTASATMISSATSASPSRPIRSGRPSLP